MRPKYIVLGVFFALVWSSAFPSAKIAVEYAPPFLILSIRFLFSGCLAVLLAKAMGQSINFNRQDWALIIAFGIIQNSLYLGLIFLALTKIDASVSVIIASILPLTIALFSWIFFGVKMWYSRFYGLIIGFFGVLVIMAKRIQTESEIIGILLCFIALLATTSANLILSKINMQGRNMLMIVGLQMLVGCMVLLPISFFFEEWVVQWQISFVAAFLYISIFPGILAPLIWFYLQKEIGTVRFSTFHFLNPFFGVLLSLILIGETLNTSDIIGLFVVTLGLYLVQNRENLRKD
jgi:drug/metabolite transporter (DMT)-like permease